jgi:uncharacterized protein (DUF736 family)
MAVIGIFTPAKDGGTHTLSMNIKLRFVPNDDRDSEQAPAFRIYAGRSELRAAWRQRTTGEDGHNI